MAVTENKILSTIPWGCLKRGIVFYEDRAFIFLRERFVYIPMYQSIALKYFFYAIFRLSCKLFKYTHLINNKYYMLYLLICIFFFVTLIFLLDLNIIIFTLQNVTNFNTISSENGNFETQPSYKIVYLKKIYFHF